MLQSYQLGFSTASIANHDLDECLRLGADMGFETVEILAFTNQRHSIGAVAGFDWETMDAKERDRLIEKASRFRLVSTHGPFIDTPLLSANRGIARESQRQAVVALEATGALGGYSCTFHVNGRWFCDIRDYWDEAIEVFRRLGDVAAASGTRVAMETGYPNTVEDYCGLIEAVDHEHVGACIDVGHIYAYYDKSLFGTAEGVVQHNNIMMEIVTRLEKKLCCFHLHDNRAEDFRDHRAAGRGIIDYRRLVAFLKESTFEGPMSFELEEPDIETALRESKQYVEGVIG